MNINKYIEQTLLNPDARSDEIIDLCNDAVKYDFQAVCVNPAYIMLAKELLGDKQVQVATVIGFPLGSNTNIVKLMEAKDAIEKGADELNVTINIGALKDGKVQYILNELQAIKKIAGSRIVKIIIEVSLLSREEIITISKIAINAGVDFIETSTGFLSTNLSSVSASDINLIKESTKGQVKVKVTGKITTGKLAKSFIEMGIERIGTSKGIEIFKALTPRRETKKIKEKK